MVLSSIREKDFANINGDIIGEENLCFYFNDGDMGTEINHHLCKKVLSYNNMLYSFDNGVIFGDSIVCNDDGEFIRESSYSLGFGFDSHRLNGNVLPKIDNYIDGTVLHLSSCFGNNYYHWSHFDLFKIIESENMKLFDKVDYIYINSNKDWHKDCIDFFNIPKEKIINSNSNKILMAKKVVFFKEPLVCYATSENFLKSLDLIFNKKYEKKSSIFFSRRDARFRKLLNVDEVEDLFLDFGFEIIEPSKLSWVQQIELMKRTEVLAGIHGASLANAIYMSGGEKLLEIHSPNYMNNCYVNLALSRKLKYYSMIGEKFDESNFKRDMRTNFKLNLDTCSEYLYNFKKGDIECSQL